MHFTVAKADIIRALTLCQGVAERRNSIPVLANVKLQSVGGGLRLTATDMDMELSVDTVAVIKKGGDATTLPVHTLADIVKKADSDQMEFKVEDVKGATIKAGGANFRLGTLPAADFPVFDDVPGGIQFDIDAQVLLKMIDSVKSCISNEETRYYLNGIYLHASAGKWRAVATDGHRMAYRDGETPEELSEALKSVILPRKAAGELRKMLDDKEGDVSVTVSEGRLSVSTKSITLSTKLIDGTYPDYERIIPKNNTKAARVDTVALADAVARVCAICDVKTRAVKLVFDDAKGEQTVTISSRADSNSAEEAVPLKAWTGGKLEIGFNSVYLQDILGLMNAEADILLSDPASPVIFHSLTNDTPDPSLLHIIMPLRV